MAEERDPQVSQRYRALGAEEPPRGLDQAILAAAHRAADHAHAPLVAPAGRHRWYFAFGAAAILVLAVAITVQLDRPQLDPDALPPVSAPAMPDAKEGFSGVPDRQSGDERAAPRQYAEQRRKNAQAPVPVASPPAEIPAKPATEEARADRLEARPPEAKPAPQPAPQAEDREQATTLLGRAGAPEAAPPAAPAAQAERKAAAAPSVLTSAVAPGPEKLLERIAELRREGRHDEADKALAEFRQRYPEYRISEEMLKKVERPK